MPTIEAIATARDIVRSVLDRRLEESVRAAAEATEQRLAGWERSDRSKLPTVPVTVDFEPTDERMRDIDAAGELPERGWYRYARSDASTTTVRERAFFIGDGWEYEGDYLMGARHRGSPVRYRALAFVDTLVVEGRLVHSRDGELRL